MKILVVSLHTTWTPTYQTDLEIIQRHLDDGDDVLHLGCYSALPACDFNQNHLPGRCLKCIRTRRVGRALLSQKVPQKSIVNLTTRNKLELASIRKAFSTLDDLKKFRIEEFDIGYAVLSSLVTARQDANPDLVEHADRISRFIEAAFCVYRSIQNYIDQNPMDRVYVFNGRFATSRAVLRACQSRSVPCFVHELGRDKHHYDLLENAMPHNMAYRKKRCVERWQAAGANSDREGVATRFYHERSMGVPQNWHSFVQSQEDGLLPVSWDPEKRNIAVFNSSDDEFGAIADEWHHPTFRNQIEVLTTIISMIDPDPGSLHFYLRMHPNISRMGQRGLEAYNALRRPFFEVLPPEDPVSTYALIRSADKVLTFRSTTGIEAAFWGTPSILAGRAVYEDLGGIYRPDSYAELLRLLNAPLPPGDKTGALMYGFDRATFGFPFKYYTATGIAEGLFRGQALTRKPSLIDALERRALPWKGRAAKFMNAFSGLRLQG